MEKKNQNKSVLTYAIFGILLLVFGYYSSTTNYAHAISVVTVTFSGGSTTNDVTYRSGLGSSNNDTTAYMVGAFGGVARVWKLGTGVTANTIVANVTLTGSSTARAIEFNPDIIASYVATNDKFYKLTTAPAIAIDRAEGIANSVRQLIYDDTHNLLYFCTNDVYGTINVVTLQPTTLYTDAGTNGLLGCAVDETNNFMYLTGDTIGGGAGKDLLKVSLTTHTVVDSTGEGANFFFGVCYDSGDNQVWVTDSSSARVSKLDSDLTLVLNITVGTTPRFCSIADQDQARRLYVNNEGADTNTIIDIDANAVISTQTVCDQGATTPKLDTKRLFNTTNTYIACPVTTNRVIIDDSVSQEFPEADPDSCDFAGNENLLRCRLADGEDVTGIGNVVGEGVTDLACNVIFTDCTDPDPQTNGIGLLIFIASIFVIIGMFYYTIGKDAFHMPIFIYVVIIIALSAFFTITGLIDPVFLVLSIVAVIALGAPKIIGVIQNRGGGFGGGSSE